MILLIFFYIVPYSEFAEIKGKILQFKHIQGKEQQIASTSLILKSTNKYFISLECIIEFLNLTEILFQLYENIVKQQRHC